MDISAKTKVCAVIGDPVEHSLSPIMHNAAFEALGLDYVYLAFQVKEEQVASALVGMWALGIHGLNVTMPHKNAVISQLDEVDRDAQSLCSVNTILNKNGKLLGFSTDGEGAVKALKENGVNPNGKRILLLGAGGAARAIAYAIAKEAGELVILNRTETQAEELACFLTRETHKKIVTGGLNSAAIEANMPKTDILINATSVGMKPNQNQSPVPPKLLKHNLAVMDIVYNPVETKLIRDAKAACATVVNGVEMLIYQGAASFEIFTGKSAPVEVMRKAALNHLLKV
jgi:shikimate dehydrogenase